RAVPEIQEDLPHPQTTVQGTGTVNQRPLFETEEPAMTIYPVTASEFAPYGRVVTGYETECAALVAALNAHTPLPEATDYVPEEKALQSLPEASALGVSLYGGMPVQFGWCNGHNTKLN